MSINSQTSIVAAAEHLRALPRALMGGTQTMRAARTLYLPQEKAESTESYDNRMSRSFLFNGFSKTIQNMAGKIFTKGIALGKDMPPDLTMYTENIDLAGRDLNMFAYDVFCDALANGISYILVDMAPATGAIITKAQEKASNRRPWLVNVKAQQVLGWRATDINGVETLTQFRFRNDTCEPDGDFGEKIVKQITVFLRGPDGTHCRTYRQSDAGAWFVYEDIALTLPDIPICPVYINRTGFMDGLPPLLGLAEVNLAHWQSQSDQRNILHFARVPLLFGAGWSDDPSALELGAGRMLVQSAADAKLTYVEHSGASIGAGRDDLKDLEFQMQVLGLELLVPKQSAQSATGAALDASKMNAPLAMMAKALEDALEQAFQFMAQYAGIIMPEDGGSIEVNKDFGVGYGDFRDLTVLMQLVTAGGLSRETMIRELQRRGNLMESIDPNEEVLKAMNEMTTPDPFANDTSPGNSNPTSVGYDTLTGALA